MRKLLTFLIVLGAIVFAVVAPVSANGVLFLARSSGGVPYTGPGDNQAFISWASVARVYRAALASTSTSLADLVDSSTGTVAICTLRGSTAGTVDLTSTYCTGSATPATACAAAAGGSCKVKKLYDQVGTNPWTQATASKMPLLTFSSINGLPAMQFASANSTTLIQGTNISQAQPFSFEAVAERTSIFTSAQAILNDSGIDTELSFQNAANTIKFYAGTQQTGTAADSAFHVLQSTFNSTSSTLNVDGTTQVTADTGTHTLGGSGPAAIGSCPGGVNYLNGLVTEAGTYNGSVQSNARSAYGL